MNLLRNRRERLASEREIAEAARLALIEVMMVPVPDPTDEDMLRRYEIYLECGGEKIPFYEVMLQEA